MAAAAGMEDLDVTGADLRIKPDYLSSQSSKQESSNRYFWSRRETRAWFVTLLMGTSVLYSARTAMPLVAPVVARDKQWSKTEIGTVLSSFFWGYTITQVIGGNLSDSKGGGRVLMTAAIGWSLLTFWMPLIISFDSLSPPASFRFIVMTRIVLGAFQGVHFPSMASLSSRNVNSKDRMSFYSAVCTGGAIGTMFTGSVGSFLLEHYGWPAVFYTVGLCGVFWVLILHYWAMELQRKRTPAISPPPKTPVTASDPMMVPWLTYFGNSAFWSCVIAHVCQNNGYFILLSWLPTYVHETFPDAWGWLFNTVPWLVSIPTVFLGQWLTNLLIRKGMSVTCTRKIIETVCLGTQAASFLMIGHVSTSTSALICMTLALAASSFHNCAILVNPQDLAPRHAGSVFGLMNTAGAIPGFVGVYVAGYIMEITKSWPAVFQVTALVNIFGCVVFNVFGSAKPIVS